jgi:hypothetical protein
VLTRLIDGLEASSMVRPEVPSLPPAQVDVAGSRPLGLGARPPTTPAYCAARHEHKLELSGSGSKDTLKAHGNWNAPHRAAFMGKAGQLRDSLSGRSSVERSSHGNGPRQKHQSVFGSEPGGHDRRPHLRLWQCRRAGCELGRDICSRHHHSGYACKRLAPLPTTPLLSPAPLPPLVVGETTKDGSLRS